MTVDDEIELGDSEENEAGFFGSIFNKIDSMTSHFRSNYFGISGISVWFWLTFSIFLQISQIIIDTNFNYENQYAWIAYTIWHVFEIILLTVAVKFLKVKVGELFCIFSFFGAIFRLFHFCCFLTYWLSLNWVHYYLISICLDCKKYQNGNFLTENYTQKNFFWFFWYSKPYRRRLTGNSASRIDNYFPADTSASNLGKSVLNHKQAYENCVSTCEKSNERIRFGNWFYLTFISVILAVVVSCFLAFYSYKLWHDIKNTIQDKLEEQIELEELEKEDEVDN